MFLRKGNGFELFPFLFLCVIDSSCPLELNCPIFEPNLVDFLMVACIISNYCQLMSDGRYANKKVKVVEWCAYSLLPGFFFGKQIDGIKNW